MDAQIAASKRRGARRRITKLLLLDDGDGRLEASGFFRADHDDFSDTLVPTID